MRIRTALPADLPALREIERAAGESFRAIGMAAIADDEPPSLEVLTHYERAGRAWVAVDESDAPVGYLLARLVDGDVHVEQVSVHPRMQGRGAGSALLTRAEEYAVEVGAPALTLTTFAEVPWNAPYYRRRGFTEAELTPGLRAVREHEAAIGLDRWPRVAMRRPVGPGQSQSRSAAR
ncbi:GNAT family N-acetyltransferase [Paractinoplanes atraurantiacus]|uniref:L-amino acid N-acyltransferase YncA n=1 Tax=Paractinoplanes atraurantiacus TaxID=1036182 RepID=A0A285JYS8_9ACTN|nr:GNAT family N-acetyltransferase [Actinoplanes atraurantiacus]SNY64917.1 L-amino acid N-acyltransferase YncA [Actinoplanes atraurantiacus]